MHEIKPVCIFNIKFINELNPFAVFCFGGRIFLIDFAAFLPENTYVFAYFIHGFERVLQND